MFSTNADAIAAMNGYVVVSLHTDGAGQRRDEFNTLRETLTGSSSNPMYVAMDPWDTKKPLWIADYNQALADSFAANLEKASRRFLRRLARRGPNEVATTGN